jgi:chitin-binding protein
MCAQAWKADPQALYDWMEVNIGDVAGRHRARIPNGRLCAAGRPKYAAFDRPGPWPATRMRPDADGRYTVRYEATAPHATRYFRYYLTKPGFDPRTDRLGWDDLRLVHDSGPLPAQAAYRFRVSLPRQRGRAILYVVWQRSDSPEAFYGCSDVVLNASGAAPAPASRPKRPAPAPKARLATRIVDDWGSGYCARGTVVNPRRRALAWSATLTVPGRLTANWDSVMTPLRATRPGTSRVRVRGAAWNAALRAGARTTFGYCVNRPAS